MIEWIELMEAYVVLNLGNLGTLVRVLVEGAANLERLRLLGEESQEIVIDTRLNEYPGTGAASLTVVPAENAMSEWSKSKEDI